MSIVALYNIVHLSTHNFEDKPSQWTMQPFLKDHAILGAVLAIAIPVSFALIKLNGKNILTRNFFVFLTLILIVCLIFTYSRAAWVSIIPALLLYFVFKLRVKFRYLLAPEIVLLPTHPAACPMWGEDAGKIQWHLRAAVDGARQSRIHDG